MLLNGIKQQQKTSISPIRRQEEEVNGNRLAHES